MRKTRRRGRWPLTDVVVMGVLGAVVVVVVAAAVAAVRPFRALAAPGAHRLGSIHHGDGSGGGGRGGGGWSQDVACSFLFACNISDNCIGQCPCKPCFTKIQPYNNNNNNNECISRAPFNVKHAQLRCTGPNTKIQNTCI